MALSAEAYRLIPADCGTMKRALCDLDLTRGRPSGPKSESRGWWRPPRALINALVT